MKKYLIIFTLIFSVFALGQVKQAYAQAGSMMGSQATSTPAQGAMQTASVETVLQDILSKQKVSTIQQLDLSKISDDDWEKLGDAVMEQAHPGQAHEVMDQMMGGEGSSTLRQMHINMGKAYLGYGNNGYGMMGGGFMGMMSGGGMMGFGANQAFQGQYPANGYGSMMGYNSYFGANNVLMSIALVALIVFLIAGTYYFLRQSNRK